MDFYDILGVSKNASQDEIKKAFRKKAHELHPDKGGDAEKFKEVNEAYQAIGDADKRAQYDRFGHSAYVGNQQNGGAPGGFGGFDFNGMNINMDDLGDFGDVLGSMFGFGGGRGGQSAGRRGRDVQTQITIDFLDAVKGVEKEITVRTLAACPECNGSGAKGGKTVSCSHCKGQGRVTRAQRTPFGVIQTAAACPECHGRGVLPETRCPECDAAGVKATNRTLMMRVPAGIGDGETIRLSGQGEAAPYGGGVGDLYVHVRVKSHPRFRRDQNDIHSEERIPVSVLMLGGTIGVETVDGRGDLNIPAGTPSGTVFKLRGYGFPFLQNRGRGDHLVTIIPEIPKKLTKEQKKLIEEMKKEGM